MESPAHASAPRTLLTPNSVEAERGIDPVYRLEMEASTLEAAPRLLLTIPEAARQLSVGRTTLYAMLKSGELFSVTVGRLRRIPIDSLEGLPSSLQVAPSGAIGME